MTRKKKDRKQIHFMVIRPAYEMLAEMADHENRSMTSFLENLIMDAYDKSGCAAGKQHPAGGDRHNAVSRGED